MGARNDGVRRRRGRPSRGEGTVLSREIITRTALEIAGMEGFGALSMHRLANTLGVTPRALYNHVRDRQELVDAVAALMMQEWPEHHLDPVRWREALRTAYHEARAAYRKYPRAILISLDETVTPAEVNPRRLLLAEEMLRFFVDIGLTLEQAIAARGAFLLDIFAFSLAIDYHYDTGGEETRRAILQPVPSAWLDALPAVDAPLARAAAEQPAPTSDEVFEGLVEMRIRAIEGFLPEA